MKATIWMGLVLLGAEPALALQRPTSEPDAVWRPAAPEQEASDWRAALGAADLDRREEAYARLLRAAQRDLGLQGTLRQWAREEGELGWTARLALRELALREDPFGSWLPGPGAGLRAGGLPFALGGDPFGSDLLRDMEERLGTLLERPGGFAGAHSSESFQMESGPDGVRVEVREQDGDDTSTRTYEADSLEQLYEQHPELRGKLQVDSLAPGRDTGFRDLLDRLRAQRGVSPFGAPGVPTDKLGILMRAPEHWSASVEGVDQGTGLYVERVFPGTLAAELGLRPGDILVSLNGRPLRSAADVQAVLSERERSAQVTAQVLDPQGERRELSWRPPERDLQQL